MEAEYYKRYEPFFGGWYIRQLIGEGGYGKVFEIERRDTLGAVFTSALKVITIPPNNSGLEGALSEGMDSESASVYFLDCVKELNREITLMSKLKGHSNIVSYEDHDIIQHEDGMGWDILIRMELLTPITKLLKDNHVFSCEEVIRLGIDLCHALELCQRYGIIHRDIKPANIFLSAADDFKLGDFGVARVTNAATAGYTRVGTLNYMAPEIFAGQPYSSNVDIYSLGLVMYQLLNANRMPFYPPYPETITYAAQERAHARRLGGEKLPAPANAPEHLAKIVLRACAPNPADRYQTAAQMRQELEALQKQEPAASGNTIVLPDPVSPEPDPTTKTVVLPDPSKKEPKPEGPTSTAPTKKSQAQGHGTRRAEEKEDLPPSAAGCTGRDCRCGCTGSRRSGPEIFFRSGIRRVRQFRRVRRERRVECRQRRHPDHPRDWHRRAQSLAADQIAG